MKQLILINMYLESSRIKPVKWLVIVIIVSSAILVHID